MDELDVDEAKIGEDDPYANGMDVFRPIVQTAPTNALVPNVKIHAGILSGALHAQATDEECAALFGLSVKEFLGCVHADETLTRIYRDARLVGRVALKKAQMNAAILGDKVMLKHLGEHVLRQVDAQPETKVAVQINQMSREELEKRWGFEMERLKREDERKAIEAQRAVDVEPIFIDWEAMQREKGVT